MKLAMQAYYDAMFIWHRRPSSGALLKLADEAVLTYEQQRKDLELRKQQETMRQVELWNVLTPTNNLENEYKGITADIAFTIKKMMCLDEHINHLKLERYHCREGSCDRLKQLLDIPDPCANVTSDVPVVQFR